MKIRSLPLRAAVLSMSAFGLCVCAHADEAAPEKLRTGSFDMCQFGANGGGCEHFEGYVYVRPGAAAESGGTAFGKPASNAELGGGRLYIHVDGDAAR